MSDRYANRAERRRLVDKYRRVDVTHVCEALVPLPNAPLGVAPCGASLMATFVVERGDPTPSVTFRHNPDGSHEPILSGTGIAATARRQGTVVRKVEGQLQ